MDALKRTERRRVLAAGALLTLLLFDVLWSVFAARLLGGMDVPFQRAGANGREAAILDALGASFAALSLASGAAWMTWQYSAHETLWQRSMPGLRRQPSIVGWWLLPLVGLFTAGFAMREIVASVPAPRWFSDRALRLLLGAWWVALLLFTLNTGTSWNVAAGQFAVDLSEPRAYLFGATSVLALALVALLEYGVSRALPWHEPAPARTDAATV